MATEYTSLLGLALPITGELDGTWGDTANDGITALLDTAVAGTTTLSSDADVTLTTTEGGANQARAAVILWTASGTTTRNITAPAQSKAYIVINATGSTQSIVIRGAGPTAGVTVPAGKKALVAWNGSDFVSIASTSISLTADVTGTLPVANGGTGSTSLTANYVLLGNGTGAPQLVAPGTSGNILKSNGTTWQSAAPASGGTVTEVTFSGGTTGLTASGGPVTVSGGFTLAGTLVVANGGTGLATHTANAVLLGNGTAALQAVAPGTSGYVLTSNGTTWAAATPAYQGTVTSVSFSGGTTGLTASGGPVTGTGGFTLSGTLALANGGTGTTSAQLAMNALAGAVTSGSYLRGNGTNVVMATIQAGDVPTLNQNTTGTASNVTGTVVVANGGTGLTTLTANNVMLGNGTSAVQFVAPGTSGFVLTSNGTTWTSAAAGTYTQARSTQTANYTIVAGDKGNLIDCTANAFNLTFTDANTLGTSFWVDVKNSGSGIITLVRSSTNTIDGLTTYEMYPGEQRRFFCMTTSTFVSVVTNPFSHTYTASATWVEPPGYKNFQGLLWGGGGGGGKMGAAFTSGGGGGGACVPIQRVPAGGGTAVTVTLATATTNVTTATSGATGGTSSFGSINAYGGGGGNGNGGSNATGGGGGGALGAGGAGIIGSTGGAPGGAGQSAANIADGFSGSVGGANAIYGGAGGGGNTVADLGGDALYGGAGGGRGAATNTTAGTSYMGGSGGAGSDSGNGSDGTAPGGGGGGTRTGTQAGAGARGELRIWGVA